MENQGQVWERSTTLQLILKTPPYSTSHGRVYSEMEDYMGLQRIPWHFSLLSLLQTLFQGSLDRHVSYALFVSK